ncbi:Sulfur carrier protein FdhD [Olavius algarvensis associated proteobacterium Delta 3]|nr:Sulfur carrier protein FdhD [Olavius algarvensis associated proteobacterium Delta 3]
MKEKGKHTESLKIIRFDRDGSRTGSHEFIGEEPLLIRIDEKPYSVVMRTPGEELSHAAGFCLGEGIVSSPDDFITIGYCKDLDPNVIDVRLTPERREKIIDILERRSFVSQTSCGICGKEMLKDLYQRLTPAENGLQVDFKRIYECIHTLSENQKYYRRTRASHAAMIFDRELEMISFAEDVGRHNALDKAIGEGLLSRALPDAAMAVLSSRMSYELVQKAARARIPILIGMSRPTALAAEMGKTLNMTLACAGKASELIVVCGENRILS